MPKRVPKDEKPFRPVENALLQSVMDDAEPATGSEPTATPKAVEPAAPVVPANVVEHPAKRETPTAQPDPAPARSTPRRQPIERFQLTPTEKAELTGFAAELSEVLETTVKPSNLHRAMLILQKNARREILNRAHQHRGQVYRPSNENHVAAAEFDFRLARIVSAALRDAEPLREA